MINYERQDLVKIITADLSKFGKLPILLLFIAVSSAIGVVMITQHTRTLITEREQLMMEKQEIDIEWRNLILEENVLGEHRRVEKLAKEKLNMKQPDLTKENIIIIQS